MDKDKAVDLIERLVASMTKLVETQGPAAVDLTLAAARITGELWLVSWVLCLVLTIGLSTYLLRMLNRWEREDEASEYAAVTAARQWQNRRDAWGQAERLAGRGGNSYKFPEVEPDRDAGRATRQFHRESQGPVILAMATSATIVFIVLAIGIFNVPQWLLMVADPRLSLAKRVLDKVL